MSNHTPGPWNARGMAIFRDGEDALSVATVNQHKSECAANAQLIAAAPDLLAALRHIAAYPDHRHSCPGDAFMAISSLAKIAIGKATGA